MRFKDLDTKIAQELGLAKLQQQQQQQNLTTHTMSLVLRTKIRGRDNPDTTILDESRAEQELVSAMSMAIDIFRAGTAEVIGQGEGT